MYNDVFAETGLDKKLILPVVKDGYLSSWAQYTIQLPEKADRVSIQAKMKAKNIPTMVYYMRPMHVQGAFNGTDSAIADCPVTDKICKTVLSLPIHPYMNEKQVKEVVIEFSKLL